MNITLYGYTATYVACGIVVAVRFRGVSRIFGMIAFATLAASRLIIPWLASRGMEPSEFLRYADIVSLASLAAYGFLVAAFLTIRSSRVAHGVIIDGQDTGHKRDEITVILPYAISNLVFALFLPQAFSMIGLIFVYFTQAGPDSSIVGAILVQCLLLALSWFAVCKWALRGYKVAVIVLFILVLPMVLGFAYSAVGFGLLGLAGISEPSLGLSQLLIASLFLIVLILTIVNYREKGLWAYAALNNACPACGRWKFGRIRRPVTICCRECGATLNFIHAR